MGLAIVWVSREPKTTAPARTSVRFSLDFSTATPLGPPHAPFVALSPEGDAIAYVLNGSEIYIRRLDALEPIRVATGNAIATPIFAPDGGAIAFESNGWIRRLDRSLRDGLVPKGEEHVVRTVCEAPTLRGACWTPSGSIVFAPSYSSGLWIADANGGAARQLTSLDSTRGEITHRWPEALPDGRSVLFGVRTVSTSSFDDADIAVVDLERGEHRVVMQGGTCPRYSRSGHLLYVRQGALFAVPFDRTALRVAGPARKLLEDVASNPTTGAAQYAIGADGTLVYAPAERDSIGNALLLVDRKGVATMTARFGRIVENPRLSPDGRQIAVTLVGASNKIGIFDLASRELHVLTRYGAEDMTPAWSPDGKWIAFSSSRRGSLALYRVTADGGREELLVSRPHDLFPCSWSPGGQLLAFMQDAPDSHADLWMLDLDDPTSPHPWLCTPHSERGAQFSPDGRWVAYDSDSTGVFQVYVRPFRGGEPRRVSTTTGYMPVWSTSGRELFYREGDRMMLVQVESEGQHMTFSPPRILFEGAFQGEYDVQHDGRSFVMTSGSHEKWPTRVHVLVGFLRDVDADTGSRDGFGNGTPP